MEEKKARALCLSEESRARQEREREARRKRKAEARRRREENEREHAAAKLQARVRGMHERRRVERARPLDALRRRAKAALDHNFNFLQSYFDYAEEKLEKEEAELQDIEVDEDEDGHGNTFLTMMPPRIRGHPAAGSITSATGGCGVARAHTPRVWKAGVGERASRLRAQQQRRGQNHSSAAAGGGVTYAAEDGLDFFGNAYGTYKVGADDFFGIGGSQPAFLQAAVREVKATMAKSLARILDLFRAMDSNRDGMVSREEFVHVLPLVIGEGTSNGVSHDADTMGAVFDSFDTGG